MARQRMIVGIGDAMLAEYPDREAPAGTALLTAIHAARLGHHGAPITRLGQDDMAERLLGLLHAMELPLELNHLQSDPDWATSRLLVRRLAGRETITWPDRGAFDNLQWDYDLSDIAQRTDAVVFGAFARRHGQTRAVIDQFVAECHQALRVFDLTRRGDEPLDRAAITAGLQYANVAILDDDALDVACPAAAVAEEPSAALRRLLRDASLDLAVLIASNGPITALSLDNVWTSSAGFEPEAHEAGVVGLIHGLLRGWDMPQALEIAGRIARLTVENPAQPLAESDLQAK